MKKKFTFLMAALALLTMMVLPNRSLGEKVTFVAGTDTSSDKSITKDGITVSVTDGTFSRDDNYRCYASQSMSISSTVGTITEVKITCTGSGTSDYGPGKFSGTGYTYSGSIGTWANPGNGSLSSSAQVRMTQIEVTYTPSGGGSTPSITVSKNSITNLNYNVGSGPSTAQSFKVSGSNLTTNITLALNNGESSKFEISKSENSGYAHTLTLEQSDGSVSETTIYVRLKSGQSVQAEAYTDRINLSSTTASATVNLSGTVIPPSVTWDLTTAQFSSQSSDLVTWTDTHATMTVERNGSNFAANAYLGGTGSYNNTHFYSNHILTISPAPHWAISKIEITATSTTYATSISNATWSNATASVSGSVVTLTPSNGDLDVSTTFSGTVYVNRVVVYYTESTAPFYSITVNGSSNGSVVASYNEAIAGKTITMSVYPDAGYCIEASNISASGATVTKVNAATYTFTMPANNVTVNAEFNVYEGIYYTLVTSTDDLIPGRKYIIASSKTNGAAYAMGAQSNINYRSQVAAVVAGTMIYETTGVAEIVLSGDATNHWTMYDENTPGYLYAASSNYLKTQNSLASLNASEWSVSITNDGDASIVSYITTQNVSNTIRHNPGSTRFSCYTPTNTMAPVYLYMKANETACKLYSATTIAKEVDCATCDLSNTNATLTIADGGILDCSGSITGATTSNLIIEDGGQLYIPSSVSATVEKTIEAAEDDSDNNWYLVASPLTSCGTGVLTTGHSYNLYKYNEATAHWNGNGGSNEFSTLDKGIGYLYRKDDDDVISFEGTLTCGDVSGIDLYNTNDDLPGFNLLGNPYSHNITSSCITLTENGAEFTGAYTLSTTGAWTAEVETGFRPCEGFLVQVNQTTKATIHETPKSKDKYNNEYIRFNVANSQYDDAAFAMFEKGFGLNKINHRNNKVPMLYIPQNGQDYAIAMMSDDTKSFNLNFKAATMGQYTLSYKANGEYSYLHVIDRLTGEDVDMLLEGEYSFVASPADNEARFIVKLSYMPDYGEGDSDIFAYQSGSSILVGGEGELQIFDVTGRNVMTTTIKGAETINGLNMGVYIFKLNEKVQKIVVR